MHGAGRVSMFNTIFSILAQCFIGNVAHAFTYQMYWKKVRNSRVAKPSYKIELRKLMSHFELLTRKFLYKFFFF